MKLIICNSSPIPIYEQIKNAMIDQIMSGELKEGAPLPSIRNLAVDIRISVMTIKKAYDELPQNMELAKEQAKKEIEEHILKAIEIRERFGIEKKEVYDILEFLMESEIWKM